jgi:hypothetical protein
VNYGSTINERQDGQWQLPLAAQDVEVCVEHDWEVSRHRCGIEGQLVVWTPGERSEVDVRVMHPSGFRSGRSVADCWPFPGSIGHT